MSCLGPNFIRFALSRKPRTYRGSLWCVAVCGRKDLLMRVNSLVHRRRPPPPFDGSTIYYGVAQNLELNYFEF
ncbi:protein CBFA2T1-like X4 [Biomphalaria glabrata]